MTSPDERLTQQPDERMNVSRSDQPADHNVPDGPAMGWDAADVDPGDLVGDEDTAGLPAVADGTQTEPDDAQQ